MIGGIEKACEDPSWFSKADQAAFSVREQEVDLCGVRLDSPLPSRSFARCLLSRAMLTTFNQRESASTDPE